MSGSRVEQTRVRYAMARIEGIEVKCQQDTRTRETKRRVKIFNF